MMSFGATVVGRTPGAGAEAGAKAGAEARSQKVCWCG